MVNHPPSDGCAGLALLCLIQLQADAPAIGATYCKLCTRLVA